MLSQRFEVTRLGGVLTLSDLVDPAEFVRLSRGELAWGIHDLVRHGFLQPLPNLRQAFTLIEAGAEAL